MTDVGDTGILQFGTSARFVPEFSFSYEDLEATGLSNTVYGADVTYQHTGDTGLQRLLVGGEYLLFDGDLAGELDDPNTPTAIDVIDDSASGFFLFGDYQWDQVNSVGVQFAMADLAEDPTADATEIDVYWTRHLTELRRLRLGFTMTDEDGEESNRVYLQFTNFFGNHSHGLNW